MKTVSTYFRRSANAFRTLFLAVIAVLTLTATADAITITIETGRQSRDCRGFGICSIIIDLRTGPNAIQGDAVLNGDRLIVSFAQPFGQPGQLLPIDQPIELDPQTAHALGASRVTILPGEYEVDYSSNPNGVVILPVQRIGITISVEVGRRSKGCTKFGICSITIEVDLLRKPTPTIGTMHGDMLVLDFTGPVEGSEDVLIIDEDIALDSATSRALGIEPRVLKSGFYPVDYSRNPNGTVQIRTEPQPAEPLGLTIHVKLGIRSQGCRGFGICDIWISADATEKTVPASGGLKEGKLRIDFRSAPDEQGSALVIDEPIELDEETSIGLGARRVVVLPGTYQVDYSSNPNGSVEVDVRTVGITIGVDVGRRSKGCTGLGICRVWIEFDLRQGTVPTIASLHDSTLTLLFTSELPEQGEVFTVEDDLQIDSALARLLGAKGLTIRKGSYVIRRDAQGRPYVELPVARIGVTVTIYVGYGSSCTGFGICRITIEVNFTRRTVQAIATANDGVLELDFLNQSPDEGSTMSLDHGLTLDAETAAALGIDEIQPGAYEVDYSGNPHGIVRLRTETSASVGSGSDAASMTARAFPNPTRDVATIGFNVPRAGHVTVTLSDAAGNVVARLADGRMEAGTHEVRFDGDALAEGVYFYTIGTPSGSVTGRIVMTR